MATYFNNGLPGTPGMPWYDTIAASYISASATTIVYVDGNGFETRLSGTFTVVNGTVTAGTISGMTRTSGGGGTVFEAITNIGNVPVMTFINAATSSDKMATILGAGDTLNGHDGIDYLRGFGGSDTLNGGLGNDVYTVENAGDVVVEDAGEGHDQVGTTLNTYTLSANVENLTFYGAGAFTGTGNGENNTIIGGASNDTLSGGDGADVLNGGLGGDMMLGGTGNDVYYVDNAGDVITDTGGIYDVVYASISGVTLAADVEGYVYYGAGGATATGNASGNSFFGGDGNDEFFGLAGQDTFHTGNGEDTFHGGQDDDYYYVNSAGDTVIEAMGEGDFDTVEVDNITSYALTANVERLSYYGAGNFTGFGNDLANVIHGNTGIDGLRGAAGNDELHGYSGDDALLGGDGSDLLFGGDDNDVLAGGVGDDTLYGDSGTDTAEYSDSDDAIVIDLSTGAASGGDAAGDIFISIENLIGSDQSDILTGNGIVNSLFGGYGNDILDGGAGLDTLVGGGGNDTYLLADGNDTVIDTEVVGIDTITTTISRSLLGYAMIENVTLLGVGDFDLTGNGLDNHLIGNAGQNTLAGVGGADTLEGGMGDDTYVLSDKLDTVVETGGIDLIVASVNINLEDYAGVENLTLIGGNVNGAGDADDNLITGSDGNNFLIGGGGKDTLRGGKGSDIYGIDSADDLVDESTIGANGIDTVKSTMSLSLLDTSIVKGQVESLELVGTATVGTGNGLDNALTGNDLVNTLTGLGGNDRLNGGLGADLMRGGAGNDTYVADAGDTIDESTAGSNGIDTVLAGTSFSLAPSAKLKGALENLTLTGIGNFSATGNGLANILIGNAGANILFGDAGNDRLDGGLGNDTMRGGAGSDVYRVNASGDVVDETTPGASGVDRVLTATSVSLSDAVHFKGQIEHLTLIGTTNHNGTGNALANTLTGNAGNNLLKGLAGNDRIIGGLGRDTMFGGAGQDKFVFKNFADSSLATPDVIKDFDDNGNDRIDLGAVSAGTLTWKGTGPLTGINQVHIRDVAGPDVLVEINLAGDTTPDMVIRLAGTTAASMTASDFVL